MDFKETHIDYSIFRFVLNYILNYSYVRKQDHIHPNG